MAERRIDTATGTETVGHEWDGIEELDTPMPRWWLWTLYATIVFSIGYGIAYPAWPLINRATTGVLGWSATSNWRTSFPRRARARRRCGSLCRASRSSGFRATRG